MLLLLLLLDVHAIIITAVITTITVTCTYVCIYVMYSTYEYCLFSPHTGMNVANVLILLISPLMKTCIFHEMILLLLLLYLRVTTALYLLFHISSRANFVIGLCAVKSAHK
jgi:hypothetical protein